VRHASENNALTVGRSLGAQRVALSAIFAVHGFLYASWAVRVPAIKVQTAASPAALGLALLGLSAGAVATMLLAGALCRRIGARRVSVPSCGLLSLVIVLPPLTHSAVTLGLALMLFGAMYGCLNVAMNSVAVDLVAALRRPVMPGFHAAWSFGGLGGAGLGGLLAPYLSPLHHLALVAACGLVVTAFAGRTLLADPAPLTGLAPIADPALLAGLAPLAEPTSGADSALLADPGPEAASSDPGSQLSRHAPSPGAPDSGSPDSGAPAPVPAVQTAAESRWHAALRLGQGVGVLGLIALCAAYDEGAIGDWGALHLKQDLGASAGLAAAAYAAFALAEACGRLSGTALLERHGRTRVLMTGGLTACAGMLVAALAPDVWLALLGFAATGLGLANMFPVAVARAGLLAGSSGVALSSTLGYSGFLIGPPCIGFLASEFGLRAGLTTLSFLGLAAAVIAYVARNSLPRFLLVDLAVVVIVVRIVRLTDRPASPPGTWHQRISARSSRARR
jgi:MFS family permease